MTYLKWLGIGMTVLALGACSSGGDDVPGAGGTGPGPDPTTSGDVEILRDARGVPHVYGATQAAAFYGLGWVSAEDRLYQMDFNRRFMRGRMAETFGGSGNAEVDDKLIAHDVRMRTLGFHRNADVILASDAFPAEIREVIQAYADGVNAYVASADFALPSAFASAGIDSFEPWTAADTLLAWERIRERFNADPIGQEFKQLQKCESPAGCFDAPCNAPIDESAAVVPEAEVWPPEQQTACHQPAPKTGERIEFKASHGWAVHGSRTTTGKPVLAMDPKLALTAPSFWYAFHVAWPGTKAAGIGIAGSPAYLIFWNEHVSHTLTAGGGDIADMFELAPSADGSSYVVDGQSYSYGSHAEVIKVKGGADVELTARDSVFGPVVTDLLPAEHGGREFALRHIDLMHQETHSLVGAIGVMSARDLDSYLEAFDKWLSPGANTVFATDDGEHGHIGYMLAGAVGKRAANLHEGVDLGGRHPYDGSSFANDWNGYLSVYERPHVIDPADGYVFSANHLPVGSWYDDYAYTGAKNVGDTLRSLRLRYMFKELLPDADTKLSPAQINDMHFDAKQDAVRLFTEMLRYLASQGTLPAMNPEAPAQSQLQKAAKTLIALDMFETEGAELRYSNPYYPLAQRIVGETPFQMRYDKNPGIFCLYNSAEGGYSFLVKSFDADPAGTMANAVVSTFVIEEAARLWDAVRMAGADEDPTAWRAPEETPGYPVAYQANQFCPTSSTASNCSLDPKHDFEVPLDSANGATIQSSLGSSGTGTIDLSAIDTSTHLVPLGVSGDPSSPFFQSGIEAWVASDQGPPGATPVAPLSQELVQASAVSSIELKYASE